MGFALCTTPGTHIFYTTKLYPTTPSFFHFEGEISVYDMRLLDIYLRNILEVNSCVRQAVGSVHVYVSQ